MSRTNHAQAEYAARVARESEKYRQKIAARDANRQLREQIRELNRTIDFGVVQLPLALAAIA